MVIFYKKWEKYNEIQLTNKIHLNIRKMTNYPPSPSQIRVEIFKSHNGL